MLSVSRQRVAQLAGVAGFPAPEAELSAGRVWSRASIQEWIATHRVPTAVGTVFEVRSLSARSIPRSSRRATVEFVNTLEEPAQVYWLDYKGEAVFYFALQPGESKRQQTFLFHPWLVTRVDASVVGIFFPDPQPRTISITDSPTID